MPLDSSGRWNPGLYPKQELIRACAQPSKQNMVCVSGPRWSGKTVGCHGAVCQHAWDTEMGNICVLTVTQGVGVDSGIWEHLTEIYLPDWIAGDFGMEWVRAPYVQGVTKKPACIVSNTHGNKTKISLESLRTEDEVEARFKGKSYSMIWINELSKFKKRKTFDTLKQCLRMPHLKAEQHLFLADTNPDLELGTESWIYKLWYDLLNDNSPPREFIPLRNSLKLIEFDIDDNLYLSEERKASILADFSHDPDLVAAYYYGKWTTASADAIFFRQFRPLRHVIGDPEGPNNPDPEMMFPEESCIELHTGWDPGPVNCAACIVEPVIPSDPRWYGKPVFKVLDELVWVNRKVDLADFVAQMLEKMEFWEKSTGREIRWVHHSDRSVLEMQDMESKKYWHQLIYEMSDGKIELEAFQRDPGTLAPGIDLMKMLVWDDRVLLNAAKCPATIQMFKSIRRGKQATQHVQKGSIHKHPFDALRYVLQTLCYSEINRKIFSSIRRKSESSLVSIPV